MAEYAIRKTETSQHGEHGYTHSEVASCRVTSQDELVNIEPELFLGMCHDPDVSLIAIVHRVRIGVFRC